MRDHKEDHKELFAEELFAFLTVFGALMLSSSYFWVGLLAVATLALLCWGLPGAPSHAGRREVPPRE